MVDPKSAHHLCLPARTGVAPVLRHERCSTGAGKTHAPDGEPAAQDAQSGYPKSAHLYLRYPGLAV